MCLKLQRTGQSNIGDRGYRTVSIDDFSIETWERNYSLGPLDIAKAIVAASKSNGIDVILRFNSATMGKEGEFIRLV